MTARGGAVADAKVRDVAYDLIVHAYDNHKTHARFQETQRSAFLVAYLGIVGIVGAPLFNKIIEAVALTEPARNLFIAAYAFLLLIGIWTALAMIKVGVEFRRHFRQAEKIVAVVQAEFGPESALHKLLIAAKMGTSGDESLGLRRFLSKRLGVASVHNYLISCVLGAECSIIAVLAVRSLAWGLAIFPIASVSFATLLQLYRRAIYDSGVRV